MSMFSKEELKDKTVNELQEICNKNNIVFHHFHKKDKLITLIIESQSKKSDQDVIINNSITQEKNVLIYQIKQQSEYLKNKYKVGDIASKEALIKELGLLSFHILRNRNLILIYENE